MTRRTTSSSRSGPTPTLCERTRFLCSNSSWSSGMCVCASLPKPVLIPYTALPSETMRRTASAPAWRRSRVEPSREIFSRDLANAASPASVSPPGSRFTLQPRVHDARDLRAVHFVLVLRAREEDRDDLLALAEHELLVDGHPEGVLADGAGEPLHPALVDLLEVLALELQLVLDRVLHFADREHEDGAAPRIGEVADRRVARLRQLHLLDEAGADDRVDLVHLDDLACIGDVRERGGNGEGESDRS